MTRQKNRVLMLLENSFPRDPRVENEAYALRDRGFQVSIIALTKRKEKKREIVNGVTVYRLPFIKVFKNSLSENAGISARLVHSITSVIGYMVEYFYFTFGAFFVSLIVAFREGFDAIHAHNPPDTLFLVGLFYKIFGKKFVFDHHDVSPELYASRFGRGNDLVQKFLFLIEKLCFWTADVVISTNQSYKNIAIERGGKNPEDVFIVRNGANLERIHLVDPDPELKKMNKTILGYLGALNPQDGVDYLLRSLHHLAYTLNRKDFYCVIIGKGDALDDLRKLAIELNLEDYVKLTGYVPDEEMLRYLSTADICVDPDPSSPLNDVSTWIKIMEYMALGKPIVTFDLKETHFSAQDAALYVPPNDEAAFAEAIVELMESPQRREEMGRFGQQRIADELAWHLQIKYLYGAYQHLFGNGINALQPPAKEPLEKYPNLS